MFVLLISNEMQHKLPTVPDHNDTSLTVKESFALKYPKEVSVQFTWQVWILFSLWRHFTLSTQWNMIIRFVQISVQISVLKFSHSHLGKRTIEITLIKLVVWLYHTFYNTVTWLRDMEARSHFVLPTYL